MKKRLLSLLLAVCVMTAMVPVMTTEARADTVPDKIVGYLESYIMQAGDTVIAVCNKKGIDFGTTRAPFLPLSPEAEKELLDTVLPLLS